MENSRCENHEAVFAGLKIVHVYGLCIHYERTASVAVQNPFKLRIEQAGR
jgi:hypothetical protein